MLLKDFHIGFEETEFDLPDEPEKEADKVNFMEINLMKSTFSVCQTKPNHIYN